MLTIMPPCLSNRSTEYQQETKTVIPIFWVKVAETTPKINGTHKPSGRVNRAVAGGVIGHNVGFAAIPERRQGQLAAEL